MKKTTASDQIDTLIFDFDGVIADSFGIFAETLGEVLGRAPLSEELLNELRGSSTREIIKKLEVKKWQMPKLIANGRKGIAEKMHTVKPFDGVPGEIRKAAKDYTIYILSTNEKQGIIDFLDKYKLSGSVEKVYSGTSIFGKSKRFAALLRHESLSVSRCIYIGDETRDIEAAHAIKMKCVAVGWGYSRPTSLKSYSPDSFAPKPASLLKAISSLK